MARRGNAAPRTGYEQVAAAVALKGSERAAARYLGISRGTVNGILNGRQGVGAKTAAAIEKAPSQDKPLLGWLANSFSSGGQGVQRARRIAARERQSPGAGEQEAQQAAAFAFQPAPPESETFRATQLSEDPRSVHANMAPGESVQQAYRRLMGDGAWEQLDQMWRDGDLTDDFYQYAVSQIIASGSGGTNVPIADLQE